MNKFFPIISLLLFCFTAKADELKIRKISVAGKMLTVEMAITYDQQQKGLMHRKKLKANHGMLFVFDDYDKRHFWMKNTFIPLSIGYFNKDKELIEVHKMQPVKSVMEVNLPRYSSSKPAKYALEVNQGWFEKNKIKTGARLNLFLRGTGGSKGN